MTSVLVLPVLVPLAAAIAALLASRRPRVQRSIAAAGAAALLAASLALLAEVGRGGILAAQLGGWPAPFGITFVADLFAAILVALAGIMGLLVVVFSFGSIDNRRAAFGYYPLVLVLLAGVCGTFLTGDLFNLFVWFEVMLLASFVLLSLGGERAQLEGSIKYVALNLVASILLLTAVGIVYGLAGTLNLADLALKLRDPAFPGLVSAAAMLMLVAFGIKAAIFPLFFWLPASYHTPPVAVTALFAALLSKVGVYALVRMFTLVFVHDVAFSHSVLLVLAGLTMVTGVLGAVVQTEVRRLLSFHIISQIGYLVMGLAIFTPMAMLGTVLFMTHIVLAKSALFLVSGMARRLAGGYELRELGGLADRSPLLAGLFLVPALSLAGLPPFSGFFAKLALVRGGIEAGQYGIVATAVAVSLVTLYSMMKVWNTAFWGPAPARQGAKRDASPGGSAAREPVRWPATLLAPTSVLAAFMLLLGMAAGPLSELAGRAATELLTPALYIAAVLGDAP